MEPGITVRVVGWDDADAVALRAAQRAEIEQRYGRPDSEQGTAPSAADIAVFVVASCGGRAVGCGGLRRLDVSTAEIKRMYVDPDARGTGVSGAVLTALERLARERGWSQLRLETGDRQPDAVAFYTRHGYRPVPKYGYYLDSPTSMCFGRSLT